MNPEIYMVTTHQPWKVKEIYRANSEKSSQNGEKKKNKERKVYKKQYNYEIVK